MGLVPSQSDQPTNAPAKWILGWKQLLSAAALLRIVTVLTSCLILLMIWESSGPVSPLFADNSPGGQKIVTFQVGNNGRASSALWNSAGRLHESGEKSTERDETHDVELEMSHRQALSEGDGDGDGDGGVGGRGSGLGSETQHGSGGGELAVDRQGVTVLKITDGTIRTNRTATSGSAEFDEAEESLPGLVSFPKEAASEEDGHGAAPAERAAGEDISAISVAPMSGQQCDFSKGAWVEDIGHGRPYYSGRECKAYMDLGFACRLTNRPSFDYENFRWQPEACNLPAFSSDQFLERMRNKVLAMVGDSLGRQQFQSLMCMLTAGKPDGRVQDVHKAWGHEVKWAYRFRHTNTTLVFYWSAPLCDIEEGRHDEKRGYAAMHLDRPPAFLQKHFHQMHVLVMNTGHHWNRGKWEMNKWRPYVNGQPVRDKNLVGVAECMNLTVHKVVEWIDMQLAAMDAKHVGKPIERQSNKPVVFMRTLSPRHFQNGDWNSGGTCDNLQFVAKSTMPSSRARAYSGPITGQIAGIAVKGTRLNLLNITYLSKFRSEGHISKYGIGRDSNHQDCLHWCLPGIPDVWNEILYGELTSHPNFSLL